MNNDLLVKLYDLPDYDPIFAQLKQNGYKIVRAIACDKQTVLNFVRHNFHDGWVNECDRAFSGNQITCYIAVKNKTCVGFACYDATAKNFFGPTGVDETHRGQGLGKALLLQCMYAMKYEGYAYCIIGWVDSAKEFYKKCVGAVPIDDSFPGTYARMIEAEE